MKKGKFLNFITKAFGYFLIYLLGFLECLLIAFCGVNMGFSLVVSIWSLFAPLPEVLMIKYGLVTVLTSSPISIALFIYVCKESHK